MIEIKQVSKTFADKKVVNNITFRVNEGDIFGFLGPNGAGKTTTIKMIIGLLEPTSGEIFINGKHNVKNKNDIYSDIGVVFELPNLYMKATIQKNLEMFSKIYQLASSRVEEVMEDLQLIDKKNMKVEKLSKGWKQRVLIARALLHKPKVLILDEPTSGLDPNTVTLIRDYIKKLNSEGTTIIISTHDMNEADELCNIVGIIDYGEFKAIGSPAELKSAYQKNEIIIEYEENGSVARKSLDIDDAKTKELISKLNDEDRLISTNRQVISLADVFYELTGGQLS